VNDSTREDDDTDGLPDGWNDHADILLVNRSEKIYVDVAITRPTARYHMDKSNDLNGVLSTPAYACRKVSAKKHEKYDDIAMLNGYVMVPFILESYGGIAVEGQKLLKKMSLRATDMSEKEWLRQAYRTLSVALQCGNAFISEAGMQQQVTSQSRRGNFQQAQKRYEETRSANGRRNRYNSNAPNASNTYNIPSTSRSPSRRKNVTFSSNPSSDPPVTMSPPATSSSGLRPRRERTEIGIKNISRSQDDMHIGAPNNMQYDFYNVGNRSPSLDRSRRRTRNAEEFLRDVAAIRAISGEVKSLVVVVDADVTLQPVVPPVLLQTVDSALPLSSNPSSSLPPPPAPAAQTSIFLPTDQSQDVNAESRGEQREVAVIDTDTAAETQNMRVTLSINDPPVDVLPPPSTASSSSSVQVMRVTRSQSAILASSRAHTASPVPILTQSPSSPCIIPSSPALRLRSRMSTIRRHLLTATSASTVRLHASIASISTIAALQ
jgi:hypothetical protein